MTPFATLRGMPREANALAAVSLALLVVKALLLNRLPSAFNGAYELGNLVDAILTSVVASYVFYVLVVHIPGIRDRLLVRPHIAKHAKQVVAYCRQQLHAIGNATGLVLELETLSEAELTKAFGALNPNAAAPMIFFPGGVSATWLQYLEHHIERSDRSIARTLSNAQFIEAKLVRLLTSIEDSSYFLQMRLVGSTPVPNADLSVWAKPFVEYCRLCSDLDTYASEALVANVP